MNRRSHISLALLALLGAAPLRAQAPEKADIVMPEGVTAERLAVETVWQGVERLRPGQRPRIVLVLGGGGAKGLSHIGVLRALQEERIPVDEIVGVSVGALIGALYASGLSVGEIEKMAEDIGWNALTDFNRATMVRLVLAEELLSSSRMETYLNERIGGKTFSDLNIPFTCIATDIKNGERVVFREGPVAIAARASATFPAIFHPVPYRHRMLVDGGVVDNLPTDVLPRDENSVVVGVLPRGDAVSAENLSIFKALVRTIEIQKDIIIDQKRQSADLMIEPNVSGVSIIDLGKSRECMEAGVVAARRAAPELKRIVMRRLLPRPPVPADVGHR